VETVLDAARRWDVRVHAQAVLSDHVHMVVSYPPHVALASFIRHCKSESARRINAARVDAQRVRWCRGYMRVQCRAARSWRRGPILHGSFDDTRTASHASSGGLTPGRRPGANGDRCATAAGPGSLGGKSQRAFQLLVRAQYIPPHDLR